MTDLAPPRGTLDLLPPRSDALEELADEARSLARRYGYRPVESPAFEHTEVFARTSGETSDVVTKEMYTFTDQGGRSLSLRPEGTAPIVRAYLAHAHDLGAPFKAYYVETMWRHDRPQAGRLREFRQFGAEVLGTDAPAADAEVIALADEYLRAWGLRKLSLLVNSIGDPECRPAYRERLVGFLREHEAGLCEDCRARIDTNPLRAFDCKRRGCREVMRSAPLVSEHLCDACREHFGAVQSGLRAAGVDFELDPRLVRGLDYYTRTAFEFVSGALSPAQATICGGGRYDGLAELLGGHRVPGIGFGLGLERLLLAIEQEELPPPGEDPVRGCFVVALGEAAAPAARTLAKQLRTAGLAAAESLEHRAMKAQLRMAARSGLTHVAIIGEREAAAGNVTLKRLADGRQEEVSVEEVVRWISSPE